MIGECCGDGRYASNLAFMHTYRVNTPAALDHTPSSALICMMHGWMLAHRDVIIKQIESLESPMPPQGLGQKQHILHLNYR